MRTEGGGGGIKPLHLYLRKGNRKKGAGTLVCIKKKDGLKRKWKEEGMEKMR